MHSKVEPMRARIVDDAAERVVSASADHFLLFEPIIPVPFQVNRMWSQLGFFRNA